jgi:predicted methyltransferase
MHRTMATLLSCALVACDKPAPAHGTVPLSATAPIAQQALCPPQAPGQSGQAVDRMREAILQGLALKPGLFVGDIGTGGGWFTVRVAAAIGKTGKVYGTDIDKQTIEALRSAPSLGEDAAPIAFTLVTGPRDAGIDALPENHLDLILMIDSLCFDGRVPHDDDVAYLRKFLRVLKPGGRLVHHMDCSCRTTVAATESLFIAAGFALEVEHLPITCAQLSTEGCPSAEAQERAKFVGVFSKGR